jgi:undecaprenyl diphosphate synthase
LACQPVNQIFKTINRINHNSTIHSMNLDQTNLPKHVAIIMDGNRRWAKAQGKHPVEGHRHVVDHTLEPLVDRCIELGISYLTLWAFSTENWDRDKAELNALMQIFRLGFQRKTKNWLMNKNIRIRVLGELDRFPKDIAESCREWMEESKDNSGMTVTFALNYGGRDEIRRSVNRAIQAKLGDLSPDESVLGGFQLSDADIAANLDTADMPDPDLIIRPGGQFRLSGFMPWQSVYAELYFTDVLMPDFSVEELEKALADYAQRQRRFGK